MKKFAITLVLLLSLGITVTSCSEKTKKDMKEAGNEMKEDVKQAGEEITAETKKVAEEVEEGIEKVGDTIKEKAKEMKNMAMGVEYQCPMKCEGDKTYHKEGKCPKCGMDMKKIEKSDDDDHGDHEH